MSTETPEPSEAMWRKLSLAVQLALTAIAGPVIVTVTVLIGGQSTFVYIVAGVLCFAAGLFGEPWFEYAADHMLARVFKSGRGSGRTFGKDHG